MCLDQIEKHFVFTSKLYHPRKRKKKKNLYYRVWASYEVKIHGII
jgi:hypothetical protein